jgi:hypothetical protein
LNPSTSPIDVEDVCLRVLWATSLQLLLTAPVTTVADDGRRKEYMV